MGGNNVTGTQSTFMESLRRGLIDSRLVNRTGIGVVVAGIGLITAVQPHPALYGIAALLALTGAVIRFWSAGIISKNRELATSGPYAYVRNPLYSGSLLVAVAFLTLNGNPYFVVPAVIGMAVIYVRTVRSEEEVLAERFGDAYRTYRERVPAVIPWKGRCEVEGGETAYSLEQSLHNKEYAGTLGVLAMLAVFYIYMNWVPQTAFRVTSGILLLVFMATRAVRGNARARRIRAQAPHQASPEAAGTEELSGGEAPEAPAAKPAAEAPKAREASAGASETPGD